MLITTNPMLPKAKLNIYIDGETISQVSTLVLICIPNLIGITILTGFAELFHPKSDYCGALDRSFQLHV